MKHITNFSSFLNENADDYTEAYWKMDKFMPEEASAEFYSIIDSDSSSDEEKRNNLLTFFNDNADVQIMMRYFPKNGTVEGFIDHIMSDGAGESSNEGQEVAVIDMRSEAKGLVDEIKDSFDFASSKLYDFKKMSDYIKREYPELSKEIDDAVEPMMTELENTYPKKLRDLLKKFV